MGSKENRESEDANANDKSAADGRDRTGGDRIVNA